MGTFMRFKQSCPLAFVLALSFGASSVFAGPSSILDPYASIQAPTSRSAKQLIPEPTAVQTSTTYVKVDSDDSRVLQVRKHSSSADRSLKQGKSQIFKAKSEKASGSFFMKGAKVLGSGFKAGDDKKSKISNSVDNGDSDNKIGKEKNSRSEKFERLLSDDKKKDDFEDDDKKKPVKNNKKASDVLAPISGTFKGTVFEIKDCLHAATDRLALTKPKPGKDSAADRIAQKAKSKDTSSDSSANYVSNGKPLKANSDGSSLVSRAFGKLPFIGGKKNSSENGDRLANDQSTDAASGDLVNEGSRKTAGRNSISDQQL